MKQTLLLILTIALGIGCKDTYDKRGHNPLSKAHYYEEKAIFFNIDYYKRHGSYPSYYTRWLYYNHKDDKDFIDSLINKTEIITKQTNTESWFGEGYSEDTISRLPIGAKGQVLPIHMGIPSWAEGGGTGTVRPVKETDLPKGRITITKWTDASKATRLQMFTIKDTVPKPTGKVLTCGENPLIMGGSGYVLGTDSLGNIIEDKGIPTWKEVSGGGRVRAWPDTNHIYYNPSKDSLP